MLMAILCTGPTEKLINLDVPSLIVHYNTVQSYKINERRSEQSGFVKGGDHHEARRMAFGAGRHGMAAYGN